MIILAKKEGDTGQIRTTSWAKLARKLAIPRRNLAEIAQKLAKMAKLLLVYEDDYKFHIEIINYRKYQDLRRIYDHKNNEKPGKNAHKSGSFCPATSNLLTYKHDFLQKSNKDKERNKSGFVRKIVTAPGTNTPTEIWIPHNPNTSCP